MTHHDDTRKTLPPEADALDTVPAPAEPYGAPEWALTLTREVRAYRQEANQERAATYELAKQVQAKSDSLSLAEEVQRLNDMLHRQLAEASVNWELFRNSIEGFRDQLRGYQTDTDNRITSVEVELRKIRQELLDHIGDGK